MGVACALAGSLVTQSSLPESLSNARKRESLVAPMNTRPPAVTMDPPILGVPVGGTPRATSSSTTPSTARQRNSPLSRSMAVRNPHGGFWHGYKFGSQKRALFVPELAGRYGISDPAGRFTMWNSIPTSIEFTYSVCVSGSHDAPPQLAPPFVPGNSTVGFKPTGVKISPKIAFSTSLAQYACDSGVTLVNSSGVIF